MDNNLNGVVIYECGWKELPDNLKTKSGLDKLGLIPNGEVVAKLNKGNKIYDLYDVNKAIKIVEKDIKLGDKDVLISSMQEVPSNLKTLRALNFIGLTPLGEVFATVKLGDNTYELYEINKVDIIDEEKYNNFKNGIKNTTKKKEEINPNDYIVRHEEGLPIYKCGWSNLPNNLKAKRGFHKLDLEPTGKVVAKIEFGKVLYDLYELSESKPLAKAENPYRISEAKKNKKETTKVNSSKKAKIEPYKIQHFNTFTLFEDEMIKLKDNYVILDTETTGIENDDEIIQLSLISLDGDVLYNGYFKPEKKSHWGAVKKHKLTDKFLADKPLWKDEWNKIANILKNKNVLIHNAIFDQRLIEQTCDRYGINIDFKIDSYCTMVYCKEKYGYGKLETVLEKNNILFDSNVLHNSLVDCFMTLKVIYPQSIVFSKQEEAQKCFDLACEKKVKNGDKDGYEKGIAWLKSNCNIPNGKIPAYVSLGICNSIISVLGKK